MTPRGIPVTLESVDRETGALQSVLTIYVPPSQPDYAAALCRRLSEIGTTAWRIALVRNCPVTRPADVAPRTAYVQGEADTFFTVPAAVRIKGRNVRGFLTRDESGFTFTANEES